MHARQSRERSKQRFVSLTAQVKKLEGTRDDLRRSLRETHGLELHQLPAQQLLDGQLASLATDMQKKVDEFNDHVVQTHSSAGDGPRPPKTAEERLERMYVFMSGRLCPACRVCVGAP